MTLARIGSLWIDGPLSWLEHASLASFVRLGHEVTLFTYGRVTNVPAGVALRDAREIWANDDIVVHGKAGSPAIHADIFRAVMTSSTDLVWVDTDVIALRPFPAAREWFIGYEMEGKLSNAVMGFPRGAETARRLAEALTDPHPVPPWFNPRGRADMARRRDEGVRTDWGQMPWGSTGPQALTHFAKATGEISHAAPEKVFFPVSFRSRKMLVDGKHAEELDRLLEDEEILSVHLYSRWMRKFTGGNLPRPNGWIGQHLLRHGLAAEEEMPRASPKGRKPPKEKGPREKGPRQKEPREKEPKVDAAPFLADLAARKARFRRSAPPARHGRLTAVTMAKDEGPYVLEWVAWHHLLGFTDILALTNDCTDGTDEMLDALAGLGLVTRVPNPPMGPKPPQSRALIRAQRHPLVTGADWVMVLDFDEFLSIDRGEGRVDDLVDLVTERGATAMPVTWRFFGSGGQVRYEEAPVTERFDRAADDRFSKGFGVKTLFRMNETMKLAIHRPHFNRQSRKEGGHDLNWVNGSGEPVDGRVMSWRQTRQTAGYDFAQMNHYGVKSGEEYLMLRLRGDVLNNHGKYNEEYFERFDRNEVLDRRAAARSAELREMMAHLLTYPEVARAAAIIRERHAAKLERLRASEGYAEQLEALGFDLRSAAA